VDWRRLVQLVRVRDALAVAKIRSEKFEWIIWNGMKYIKRGKEETI